MSRQRMLCSVFLVAFLSLAMTVDSASALCNLEHQKLTASDGVPNDLVGTSVAVEGNTAVIGAKDATGVGGLLGAAYVFLFDGISWNQVAKLTASDGVNDDEFGMWVAISGDTVVIGADQHNHGGGFWSGSAYVFVKPGGGWTDMTQTVELTASDAAASDLFGIAVDCDGNTIVIGARENDDAGSGSGSAYVFEKGAGWVNGSANQTAKLAPSPAAAGDRFGTKVAIAGQTIVVGADQAGSGTGFACVFEKGAGWVNGSTNQTARLTASDGVTNDRFGDAVTIGVDTVGVGAFFDDDSASDSGSAYVFVKPGGGWADMTQTAKLTASDATAGDWLGISISMSSGGTVIVGAYQLGNGGPGSAYVFDKPGGGWVDTTETCKLTASDGVAGDRFGNSVSISGTKVLVGAPNNSSKRGAVYAYCPQDDADCDGIVDASDNCPLYFNPAQEFNKADLDKDCDVDGNDFLTFSNCFNGSLNPPSCPSGNLVVGCSSGWVKSPINGHCYKLTSVKGTWNDAEAEAVAAGGHLATIRNASENQWILENLAPPDALTSNMWIGFFQFPGSNEPADGWVWSSGEPVTYTNWPPGEPNNSGPGEHWGEMQLSGAAIGQWNDQAVTKMSQGVMELP